MSPPSFLFCLVAAPSDSSSVHQLLSTTSVPRLSSSPVDITSHLRVRLHRLQSYILMSVMGRVHAGTARPSDIAMLPSVASLPQSITISTLSTLKTWIGLVEEANKAGISIKAKAWQLWNVGGGLPLDALKKGAIDEWTCSYRLDEGEISPLIDALEENASLVRLKLSDSGECLPF